MNAYESAEVESTDVEPRTERARQQVADRGVDSTDQFERVVLADPTDHLELRGGLADSYYPPSVFEATLIVRWYANDDFTIHYRESHEDNDWECRWDRHPNPHTSRDHFHPPPDATTPGDDRGWRTTTAT